MKKSTLFNVAIASAAGLAIAAAGCSRTSDSAKTGSGSVTSIPVQSELLSISKTYPGYTGVDSCSLTINAVIDYPTVIGSDDIAPLQEAIKDVVFNNQSGASIESLMDSFATGVESYELNIDPSVTGAPAKLNEVYTYYTDVTLSRTELNSKMITYQLVDSRYLGGAHEMTYSRSFTYSFADKELLTLENMFKPDKMDIVFSAVNATLAQQYDVMEGELQAAGFYQNAVGVPNLLSVQNNMIVFHYNPYDIAPHSTGAIDVAVSPVMVKEALTPMALKLLF
ncbi:MAG: RsiV family protein [Paramuribaculum sp.]|nr:RsiV family protein [Paramuribaculum sp.]MDE6460228.1 RsiV family protein [Paramuribaculum sp.]